MIVAAILLRDLSVCCCGCCSCTEVVVTKPQNEVGGSVASPFSKSRFTRKELAVARFAAGKGYSHHVKTSAFCFVKCRCPQSNTVFIPRKIHENSDMKTSSRVVRNSICSIAVTMVLLPPRFDPDQGDLSSAHHICLRVFYKACLAHNEET